MNAVVPIHQDRNVDSYRASTDAAGLCRDIVVKTAKNIQGRKYVCVEGWQAIAIAHGCTASADSVERVPDEGMSGFKAIGIVRRMSDGVEIARAEGFLGDDEGMWAKRPVYARRAMVQTRAISRACRSAFAHVVVMIDAGLSTTPAEEVPDGGFEDRPMRVVNDAPPPQTRTAPAREKAPPLTGPIKTRSALRIACGNFVRELEACADPDQLEALLTTEQPLIDQVREEHELFWKGDGGEFLGLEKEIERAKMRCADDDGAWRDNTLRAG